MIIKGILLSIYTLFILIAIETYQVNYINKKHKTTFMFYSNSNIVLVLTKWELKTIELENDVLISKKLGEI